MLNHLNRYCQLINRGISDRRSFQAEAGINGLKELVVSVTQKLNKIYNGNITDSFITSKLNSLNQITTQLDTLYKNNALHGNDQAKISISTFKTNIEVLIEDINSVS